MSVRLPDWPAKRLVLESIVAWGLRHPDEEYVDYLSAPWPLIQQRILAFLRHQHSGFDEALRLRCERDDALRDELATEVARAAFRKYPWLSNDPRPFPAGSADDGRFLNYASEMLANLHTLRDHIISAISDLRRTGNHKNQIVNLKEELKATNERIAHVYEFLTVPKMTTDSETGRTSARSIAIPRQGEQTYYFFTDREEPLSYLTYAGFRCPRCEASVMRRKGTIDLGQGYNRVAVWSCFCTTFLVYQPPQYRLSPMTVTKWEKASNGSAAAEETKPL